MADRYNNEIQALETLLNELTNLLQSQERMMNEYRTFATDFMSLIQNNQFLENSLRNSEDGREVSPLAPETEPEQEIQKSEDIADKPEFREVPLEHVTALYISEDKEEPVQIELSVDQLLNDSNDFGMIRNHNDNTAILYRQNDQGEIGEISMISSILSADIRNIDRLNGDVYIIGLGADRSQYVSLSPGQIAHYEQSLKKDQTIESNAPEEAATNPEMEEPENNRKEQKPEKISCLLVKPGQYPEEIVITNTLENLQHAVGGSIQEYYFDNDNAIIVCNEEGKINGSDLNRAVRDDYGSINEIIAGNFLVVGNGPGNFTSLTQEQINKYEKMFHQPETFYEINGNIYADPIPDETVRAINGIEEPQGNKIPVEYGLIKHNEGEPYEVYMNAVIKFDDGSEAPLYASCKLDMEHQENSFNFLYNEIKKQAIASAGPNYPDRLDFDCFQSFDLPLKKETIDSPERLAFDLDQFAYEYDTYSYNDAYDSGSNIDNNIDKNIKLIESGDVEGIRDWLSKIPQDDPSFAKAQELLDRLNAISPSETKTEPNEEPQKETDEAEEKEKPVSDSARETEPESSKLSILNKNNFEYEGKHYQVVGLAVDPSDVADIDYVGSDHEGDYINYDKSAFYEKSGIPSASNADVFYCFEYHNYYFADDNRLVEYYGEFKPMIVEPVEEKQAEALNNTPQETAAAGKPAMPADISSQEEPAIEPQSEPQNGKEVYHVNCGMLENPIFGKDIAYMTTTLKNEHGEEKNLMMQIAFNYDNPQQSYNYLKSNFMDLAEQNAYITPDQLEFADFNEFAALAKNGSKPDEHEPGFTQQHDGYTEKTEKVYEPEETNLPYGVETHTLKFDDEQSHDEIQHDLNEPEHAKSI